MTRNSNIAIGWFGLILVVTTSVGCRPKSRESASVPLTSTEDRSERRAFDGSPPVIPHQSLGAKCEVCHTEKGSAVPGMAFAPANPHGNVGSLQNCRQCHLFQQADDLFAETEFQPLPVKMEAGSRLFPGAPPTIPHSLQMRNNCLACHAGPTARPEIRCSHPERTNCVQCHVVQSAPHHSEFLQVTLSD